MLFFIDRQHRNQVPGYQVSIHLMLFFISFLKALTSACVFQYISCYSLSGISNGALESRQCFNTSHVILYLVDTSRVRSIPGVSIHLMLFFIPRFSNLFHANFLYNSAKYKDLQHFSQVM